MVTKRSKEKKETAQYLFDETKDAIQSEYPELDDMVNYDRLQQEIDEVVFGDWQQWKTQI